MTTFTITDATLHAEGWAITYMDDDTGTVWGHSFPVGNLETLMAEYGLEDPAETLDILLHDPHAWAMIYAGSPADDPAVAEGWVTTTDPDAVAISLYTARSTADARGAHRARIAAVKATGAAVVNDPNNLLAAVLRQPLDDARVREHQQVVDTLRWQLVYGALPTPPVRLGDLISIQQGGN